MKITTLIFSATFLFSLFLTDSYVRAHESQTFRIGGREYDFVIGSLNEPVAVDDKTGVDLRVSDKATKAPVTELEQTLKVELIAGDKKKTFNLAATYGTPGSYRAVFIPTVQTTYTYRIVGTINGVPVDLSFTCNPAGHLASPEDLTPVEMGTDVVRLRKSGAYGCPVGRADLGFPEPSATVYSLRTDAAALEEDLGRAVSSNRNISVLAAFLGVVGIGLGIAARRRNG